MANNKSCLKTGLKVSAVVILIWIFANIYFDRMAEFRDVQSPEPMPTPIPTATPTPTPTPAPVVVKPTPEPTPAFVLADVKDEELPDQVELLESEQFVLADGAGTATAAAGREVNLIGIKDGRIEISYLTSRKTVPLEKTNFKELVLEKRAAFKAAEARRIEAERLAQKKADSEKAAEEARQAGIKEKIKRQFNLFNGSNIYFVEAVKKNMHDPSSFKHVETTYVFDEPTNTIVVRMKFRGKNAVGGTVLNSALGRLTLDGTVLEIEPEN